MMHWRASRLLASLPDGTLPEETELEVRVHAASCARCRRRLREFELAEDLLRRMPAAIQPLEWSPSSYRRLASLASWSTEPELPEPESITADVARSSGDLSSDTVADAALIVVTDKVSGAEANLLIGALAAGKTILYAPSDAEAASSRQQVLLFRAPGGQVRGVWMAREDLRFFR